LLRIECQKRLDEMKDDLRLVKSALVGTDMRGGLVNQVNTLSERLSDIITTQKLTDNHRDAEKKEEKQDKRAGMDRATRWKISIVGVISGLLGVIIGHLLDLF